LWQISRREKNRPLFGHDSGNNLTFMKSNYIAFLSLLLALGVTACQPMRNFTTYYNRFYNMERIMNEVEDELLYIREQKTPQPTYHIPYDDLGLRGARIYNHLERRTMTAEEAKANKIKLDSILIKGSMLLARNNKSDYVPDAVFYIGKTYFYQREWYQAQKKYDELIANFPESQWLPDAHLFYAMALLEQGDVEGAERMLSRAIDIAFGRQRRDVLTEAFRLNADINLAKGDLDKAIKPYRRALLLSNDDEERARWQYETGLVYFRAGDFASALREFDLVDQYSPDVLTEFQNGIQRAVTLRVLGEYDRAEAELDDLRSNGNFEEWWGMVDMERLNLAGERPGGTPATQQDMAKIDSGKYAPYGIYERAIRAFRAGDYETAYQNFQKVQSASAPFQRRALFYTSLLSEYRSQLARVRAVTGILVDPWPDTTRTTVSDSYYNVARVFASFAIPDSIRRYYDLSSEWAPAGSLQAARAIYARSASAREAGHLAQADSLLEILVADYQLTEYAADARVRLGYTEAAKIDPAKDLYTSGMRFMQVGEYTNALPRFNRVVNEYAQSPYAPQALYAIGLLYEQHLNNYDSAFAYYFQILNRYPTSEQATAVKPIIDAVLAARANGQQPNGEINSNDSTKKETPPQTLRVENGLIPLDQADGGVDNKVERSLDAMPSVRADQPPMKEMERPKHDIRPRPVGEGGKPD
jgi:TolA-binding protein